MLKTKQELSNDEFDYLTTEFGAYFGQLIHSQLMKLRNQQTNFNNNNNQSLAQSKAMLNVII